MRHKELRTMLLALPDAKPRECSSPWPFLYSVPEEGGLFVNLEPEREPVRSAESAPSPEAYTVTVVKRGRRPGSSTEATSAKAPGKKAGKRTKAAVQQVSALSLPDVWKR